MLGSRRTFTMLLYTHIAAFFSASTPITVSVPITR